MIKTCDICGNKFEPVSDTNRRQKRCSSECRKIFQSINAKKNKAKRERACKICNKKFQPNGKQTVCSEYCRVEAKRRSKLKSNKKLHPTSDTSSQEVKIKNLFLLQKLTNLQQTRLAG